MKLIRSIVAAALVVVAGLSAASARDNGQWTDIDVIIGQWFRSLTQPDDPQQSCCGVADAYYADSFETFKDQYIAIITDERDDQLLGRPHIAVGTRILVPNHKLKIDAGNPTGHGVIFVNTSWQVFCYVVPGGG